MEKSYYIQSQKGCEYMLPIQIDLPKNFLEEEIRCGYKISSEMKKVWAVQIDLLEQVKKICKKHGLKYFADSGTLIGAIRHKGYIPWDDDIDLVMMRNDYNKFMEYAKSELEFPYFLQTVYTDKDIMRAHAQLRNSKTTGYMPYEKNRPYNKGIFIDIFPLDVIPEDPQLKKFSLKIKFKWKLLNNLVNYKYNKKNIVSWAKHYLIVKPLTLWMDYKILYANYERLCSQYNNSEFNRVSYIAYSHGKKKHIWNKEWFDSAKEVDFEFTKINIPVGYNERLKTEYGDYMVIKNVPSSHGELILSSEKSYMEE